MDPLDECYCGEAVSPKHPECVRARLNLDFMLYGTSYELQRADGTIDRIDPIEVVVRTRG